MNFPCIYKATNLINGKSYVGLSTRFFHRWKLHKRDTFSPSQPAYHYPLHRAMRKHGLHTFCWEILETPKIEQLKEREKYWISHFDTFKSGYNCTEGGDGVVGLKFSEETKQKMRLAKLGKYNGKKHPLYGIPRLESTKAKLKQYGLKPIQQFSKEGVLLQEFPSIVAAAIQLKIDNSNISGCCKGKYGYKTAGGFVWRYKCQQ
jgi:hypothetical protein